jgi:IS30 family transposase
MLKIEHKISYSAVSIYKFINHDRLNNGNLYTHLRQAGKRRAKYGNKYQGRIKDRVSISKRPDIVDDKSRIGDFEADTIIGAGKKGAIITIVDRKSMYLKMSIPSSKKADETAKKIIQLLKPYKDKVHTITTDNGFEFSDHKKVSQSLKCEYYFCHPYSSWERGLNENINGLIRQYIPKGSSFSKLTKRDIQTIENKLNHRPRKSLNWKTPYEVFHEITLVA